MGWGRKIKISRFGNSAYNTKGETLSEKNAISEFLLNANILEQGVDDKMLTVQHRSCHGSSYRLFVRSELERFVRTCPKDPVLLHNHTLHVKRARLSAILVVLSDTYNLSEQKKLI